MILTMKFDMENDEDRVKFNEMNDARNMTSAIIDVYQYIRGQLKHGSPTPEVVDALEHIRELLNEELHGCKTEFI